MAVPSPIAPAKPQHSALVRVTHWISALSFLVLVLSGIAILLAHPRLYWGEVGAVGGPSLIDLPLPFVLEVPIRGPGRYLHFLAAWVMVFTGLVYVARGLAARHFRNLLPARDQLTFGAIGRVIRSHLRFERSTEAEFATYNVLQRLSYTTVVFVLIPLMIWTGLAMSPAVTSVFPFLVTALGGQQTARTVHFFVTCALVLFFVVHVVMVWLTGFRRRMRAMITGRGPTETHAIARAGLSRRAVIKAGLGALAGVGAFGVVFRVADRFGLIPANHRGIYGLSETLTYAGQRLLTKLPSRVREFDRSQISKVAPVNGRAPTTIEPYQQLMAGGFVDWRLQIEGMVAHPSSLSLAELKSFPSRSQITHQACEEGWSFIAEWTGVPLSYVLEYVGIHPDARYVFFFAFGGWWDSIDMDDALHPQTLLVYAMNGPELPLDHGAPLRLKVPRQLGYKNTKYLSRIMVTDSAEGIGDGLGSFLPAAGYSWYAGI